MKKRHYLVLAVAAMSLMLTGCGDKNAAAVGEKAGTELTSANFIDVITSAQTKAKSSHVEMKIDASGQKVSAAGDIEVGADSGTKVAMKLDLGSSGMGSVEMRLIGKAVYFNLGPISQNKFGKIDLTDAGNPVTAQYGKILDQLDPSKQIELFKDAMKSMEKKGDPIELDGVQAQPYLMTLDTSKLPSIAELGQDAEVPKEATYTLYVGPDNLPRRITTDIGGSSVTINYSRWGEAVDITVPPKDQIADKNPLGQLG